MIRLHLLGITPDLKGLVFSGRRGGRSGTYWVPVDEKFQKALAQLERARSEDETPPVVALPGRRRRNADVGEPGTVEEAALEKVRTLSVTDTQDLPLPPSGNRVQSKLSPREIQQLLREGKSVADVAGRAEVEAAWVERFLGPILEERAGVVRATRNAVQARPRLGPSGLPIGQAVIRNLVARKATDQTLAEVEEGWEARRLRPRTWRVRLRFTHRAKRRTAEWEFRKDTGGVKPRNKLATELGWWPPPDEQSRTGSVDASAEDTSELPPAAEAPKAAGGSRAASVRTAGRGAGSKGGRGARSRGGRPRRAAKHTAGTPTTTRKRVPGRSATGAGRGSPAKRRSAKRGSRTR